jgi:phosphoglycolate/pyridoxal phosphate phosphatase family enzyme
MDACALRRDLEEIDIVLFDCDGVLYQGDHLLAGVQEALSKLKSSGKSIKLITNTSARSRAMMHHKLVKLGISSDVVGVNDCFPSSVAAAKYLKDNFPHVNRMYVVGTNGLVEELSESGFECIGGSKDNDEFFTEADFLKLAEDDLFVDAVVVGYDTCFSYYKIAKSSLCLQKNPKCLFIATNDDIADMIGGRWYLPGNGAAIAAITAAVSGIPDAVHKTPIITGKPNRLLGEMAVSACGLGEVDPRRVLVVGDRLDTDIALAKNCGYKSCLVLSGVTRKEELGGIPLELRPDYVIKGLTDFLDSSYSTSSDSLM